MDQITVQWLDSSWAKDAHRALLNQWLARCQKVLDAGRSRVSVDDGDQAVVLTVSGLPSEQNPEAWTLSCADQQIALAAGSQAGLSHGLSVLLQLLVFASENLEPDQNLQIPACSVADEPQFAWRGLLLDCARHFLPITALRRTIAAMPLARLNVLHLHLTDDQAFRFECHGYPQLHRVNPDGHFYTQDELRDLVSFAQTHNVRIVPELDMPGHTSAWSVAYPWLSAESSAQNDAVQVPTAFGIQPNALDPTREEVFDLIKTVIAECAAVFPDPYIHLGGDEVHHRVWQGPRFQAFCEAQAANVTGHLRADLQAWFSNRVCALAEQAGKRVILWDEALHPALDRSVVIQAWRGVSARDCARAAGFDTLLSAPWYLDLNLGNAQHHQFSVDGDASLLRACEDALADSPRFSDAALEPLRAAYLSTVGYFRKLPDLPEAEVPGALLGGEACLWSELVRDELLDRRLWSRLPAVADSLWGRYGTDARSDLHNVDYLLRGQHLFVHTLVAGFALDPDESARLWLAQQCAGANDAVRLAFAELMALLEPLPWYGRHIGIDMLSARAQAEDGVSLETDGRDPRRPYNTTTPLNRAVDYVRPESLSVQALLSLPANDLDSAVRNCARQWRGIADTLISSDNISEALQEIMPLATMLGEVSDMLLQPGDAEYWAQQRDRLRTPVAELQLAAVFIVDRLIDG